MKIVDIFKRFNPINNRSVVFFIIVAIAHVSIAFYLSQKTDYYEIDNEEVLMNDKKILEDGLRLYYNNEGHYPSSLEDLVESNYLIEIPGELEKRFEYVVKNNRSEYMLIRIL